MLMILWSIFIFIITVSIIIIVHEFGHFGVARMLGMKVLRFSIGLGKPLWRKSDSKGTEYAVAAFPFGGYVKLLDEHEGNIKPEDYPYAFNRRPIWQRTLVVLAGPAFNLILAFVLYWLMYMIGITMLVPKIGEVIPNSIASQAGLQPNSIITAINHHAVDNWQDVLLQLTTVIGSEEKVMMTTQSSKDKTLQSYILEKTHWHLEDKVPDPLKSIGLRPYLPPIPPIIHRVTANSPAFDAGLQANDKIVMIAGKAISDWRQIIPVISTHPNQPISIRILRHGKIQQLTITPGVKQTDDGKSSVYLGIEAKAVKYPSELIKHVRYNPLTAISSALKQTYAITTLTIKLLIKMVKGQISLNAISGPVGIAQGAGISASLGIASYLDFIALLSISIGVINILPIPVLDGGHLIYFMIEFVTGRPVSEKAWMLAMQLGILLLISLTILAIYNDLTRIF